jgi:membrane protein required for colicin V production
LLSTFDENIFNMNFIDLVLLIPILWFGYKGFTKGFIIEIASLAALMLGLYGGIHFSGFVAGYLSKWFEIKSDYVPLISFSVTFLLIVIVVFLVAKGVDKLVKSAALGLPNRIAGAIIGAAKTIVILSVVILLTNKYDKNGLFLKDEIRNNSLLYNPISKLIVQIYPSVSETLSNVFEAENKENSK